MSSLQNPESQGPLDTPVVPELQEKKCSCTSVSECWWVSIMVTSAILIVIAILLCGSLFVHYHLFAKESIDSVEARVSSTQCANYRHSKECDNNSFCIWNNEKYECTPRFRSVSEENSLQCPARFFRVETASDCRLAASFETLQLNTGGADSSALDVLEVVLVNDPGHPQGCYLYNSVWYFNEAKFVQSTPDISSFRFVCKSIPEHCWNGVLDCDREERGIDCGNVCKTTCSNVDSPCPPPVSTQVCKRNVYASNDQWSAMFLYLWTTLISSISTKRQTLDCTNDEYIYNSNYGRCTLDDEGKLRISVTGFESTHALCNMDGFPASHDSPDFRLKDDTFVRGTCSTLYFIHPMTVVTKQDKRNTYNMPWEWNDPFANEQAARKSNEYWRSQLICSPFHEDKSRAVYTERCCFGY